MKEIVYRAHNTIAYPNDVPYLNNEWRPVDTEWVVTTPDLEVIGDIPVDLDGVYLRNAHVPIHQPIGRYHPYDGNGMVHAMRFHDGRVEFRNRWIRTVGFYAEEAAGRSLWPGIIESRRAALRGWGSIGAMKDNAGVDIAVHAGRAIASMSQCGEPYRIDPLTLETLGVDADWAFKLQPYGICSHFKLDEHTGDLMFFNFGERPPYMNYGVVDKNDKLVHYEPIGLPGARWPHDLGFTEHYSILHDLPMFFDPEALKKGGHRLHFYRDLPSRFGVMPRFGNNDTVRWFEAGPCYVLHLSNCYETGDEIVMDGCIQTNPVPNLSNLPRDGYERIDAMLDLHRQNAHMHRWRFNLKTGRTAEHDIDDTVTEFPTVNGRHAGRPYRYSYNAIPAEGRWRLDGIKKYDVETGLTQTYMLPPGCSLSEAPFAPRPNASAEDDGYLVTFVSNVNTGRGECAIFDACDITVGPIARVILPDHVPTGTHAFWMPSAMLNIA
jgi:carotenoid cleavage dioxygenase-like enzyme